VLLVGAAAGILLGCLIGAVLWTQWDGERSTSPPGSTPRERVPAGELTAAQVLDRVARTYASCESYRDSGVVKTALTESGGRRWTEEKPFKTAFVRPDRFRFEYTEESFGRQVCYIICADGKKVLKCWDLQPGVEEAPSLGLALAGATGVSGGSAHTIPALLLPRQVGGRLLTDLPRAKRMEDGPIDGNACFRLEASLIGQPITVWVDQQAFTVRRIDEQRTFPGFRTETTTTYEPAINCEIPPEMLEFNRPPAGGGAGLLR
jgi:outer membrane lipoprotein-sorting protein